MEHLTVWLTVDQQYTSIVFTLYKYSIGKCSRFKHTSQS